MTPANILLVDDDAELLKALSKTLEKDGYHVVGQRDAADALRGLETGAGPFDLVITDVSMPGMRGTALLSALKTAFPDLPVIVITAFGDWGLYATALRQGVTAFLDKPLDRGELLAAVRSALANRQQTSERVP